MIEEYSFFGFPYLVMRLERLHSPLLRLMGWKASVKCTLRLEGNGSVSF